MPDGTPGMDADAIRARFVKTAALAVDLEARRRAALRERVTALVPPVDGDALDSGCGTGALAFALTAVAPRVVACDFVPELLALGREVAARDGFDTVEFREADAMALPFADSAFALSGCHRTLHHVADPEACVAELVRVTAPGGLVLVIDQLGPDDPAEADALHAFEQARDSSHGRLLTAGELRALLERHGLEIRSAEVLEEPRNLERYLDLGGVEGEQRERARALAPPGLISLAGWFLAARRPRA